MTPVARFSSFPFIFLAAVSCNVEQVSAPPPPDHSLALHRNGNTGNPDCRVSGRGGDRRGPVDFLCAIEIPGNPITSSQKGWVEQSNGMYFLSDASNFGADVIDIRTHTYVGRVSGMAGNAATGGGTATTNGPGPNAFVSAPRRGGHGRGDHDDDDDRGRGANRVLFVSDGNSTVHVVDMDRRQIIASVSTAMAACDGGTATTKYCGRSNEIAYDPVHHVVLVQNPAPLTVTTPRVNADPYATFISAEYPYRVLGHITFPAAVTGNLEGHVWVPELNRFLLPVQPNAASGATRGSMYIAVINARTRQIEDKRVYFCPEIAGTIATSTGNNNLQLAPGGNLWAQMCGRPIRMDVRTGVIKNVVAEVGTGDQAWYNPGDGNFYVTGTAPPAPAVGGVASLGVINGRTGAFLQAVPSPLGASPTAYAATNEIFTRVVVNAAIIADPTTDNSRCVVKGRGCVVVFAHVGSDRDDEHE
jgi:hypothetical protein